MERKASPTSVTTAVATAEESTNFPIGGYTLVCCGEQLLCFGGWIPGAPAKTPAAKCPLPKLPNSPALSRAVVAAGPVSHARWAVLLGVACALDAMTLGKGGEAWAMEWSEQTWIATNACFLLVLYCAMRLN